jgi:hypothetical protein
MPPRWPRQPDRKADPEFRRLDDRMTFATHVAIFAACNSGLWFFNQMDAGLPASTLTWVSGVWLFALFAHGVFIFAIANYKT